MTKLYLLIFFILFNYSLKANEDEKIEVIELHKTKTFDQMVTEQIEDNVSSNQDLIVENNEEINENNSSEKISIINDSIETNNFWINVNENDLANYLLNLKNLKSNLIQSEIVNLLETVNLDYSLKENQDKFYLITKYFYETGNITKAYSLLNTRDLQNDNYSNFYNTIKINYLLSTFQLEEVCNLNQELSSETNLENFLLEKIDIFCLILEDNLSEAELFYSILLEEENNIDTNYQKLYSILSGNEIEDDLSEIFSNNIENNNLIFLYSAMARIGDLPLNNNFLEIDKKNLSIPIILNKSTPINLRIKAANNSFENNNITIDSLAALYQSVDFTSEQLDNPDQTIATLSKNIELLMAYHFQLINIQIFPSERLKVLINFWEFAKNNNLQHIAYSLSYKILQSIEKSSENLEYSPSIATSYIFNKDFENAFQWIEFYELNYETDEKISFVKILYNLYSAEEVNSLVKVLTDNLEKFSSIENKKNEELIFIISQVLSIQESISLNKIFDATFDDRQVPSIFILDEIRTSIAKNNYDNFLIYSSISLNNKEWHEIHPEHLKLLLSGYLQFNSNNMINNLILEIFKNYKML